MTHVSKIYAAINDASAGSRVLIGSDQWCDVEVKFTTPLNFRSATLVLSVALQAPSPLSSLRLALICGPSVTLPQAVDETRSNVLEYRQVFRPGHDVVFINERKFIKLEGNPDPETVSAIYFGGIFPCGTLNAKLFLASSTGKVFDLLDPSSAGLAATSQSKISVDPQELSAISGLENRILALLPRVSNISARIEALDSPEFSRRTEVSSHESHLPAKTASSSIDRVISVLKSVEEGLCQSVDRFEKYLAANYQPLPQNDATHVWHPTWVPSEVPMYFHGNSWSWADKFKEYYFCNKESIPAKMAMLTDNLDLCSVRAIEWLWDTAVFKIPFAESSANAGALLRRDYVYSPEDLVEQTKVLQSFEADTSEFTLPAGKVMEIPVFSFHHGLRDLDEGYLRYIAGYDALDCGGFIGDSAIVLSKKYKFRKIISIEPNPDNLEIMSKVLSMNGVTNVVPMQAGLAEHEDKLMFHGADAVTTAVKFDEKTVGTMAQCSHFVRVRTIDEIVANEGIEPRFIKFDIEGFELAAIRGGIRTIEKHRPIMSISIYHRPEDMFEIKPFLDHCNLGYRFSVQHQNPFDPIYETVLLALPEI